MRNSLRLFKDRCIGLETKRHCTLNANTTSLHHSSRIAKLCHPATLYFAGCRFFLRGKSPASSSRFDGEVPLGVPWTGVPRSAGVPRPENGVICPEGGTGISRSSGLGGTSFFGTSGMKIRLASLLYEAGMI